MNIIPTRNPGKYFSIVQGMSGLPSRFPSVPVCGKTAPDSAPDFFSSQNNPFYINNIAKPMGRSLRGLGLLPTVSKYQDKALKGTSAEDDVVGNGIFDSERAPATAHAKTGVFESRFSLPGYVYRERPTHPGEIVDTTTGNPLVYLPNAGGSWFDDVADTYRSFDSEVPRYYPLKGLGAQPSAEKSEGLTTGKALSVATWIAIGAIAAAVSTVVYKRLTEYE